MKFCQNQMLFVKSYAAHNTQMYTWVYLCNTILVTGIFCYRYSAINFGKSFSTKFGNRFRNLLGIKCKKLYLNLFRFDVIIARCLSDQFFLPDTMYVYHTVYSMMKCLSHQRSQRAAHGVNTATKPTP